MSGIGVDFSYSDQGLAETSAKLNNFFGQLQNVGSAASALSFPPLTIGLAGAEGANAAISNMQAALQSAETAATPLRATLARLEAVLHGTAAVARITSTALLLFPKAFAGLPPAISKSLSGISLASRAFDVFRGKLTPLGGVMSYLEMRNLGLSKSYSALASTLAFATSAVVGSTRKVSVAAATVGGSLIKNFATGTGRAFSGMAVGAMALLGPLAAVGGVAGGVGIAVAGMKKAVDLGGELSDLNARTGIAIKDLMVLQQAFTNAGVGADGVGPAVNRLQKALTGVNEQGEPTNKTFQRLGLEMDSLKSSDPTAQFKAVGKAISELSDPSERSAAAMAIFGKSGAELLAVFADSGALGDAAADVGSQADILARNAALFDKISDILGTAGVKLQGFFVGMAEQIAPVIEPLLDLFRNTDFASFGQTLGQSIALGLQALTDGSLLGILGASARVTIGGAVNFLWRGLSATMNGAGQLLLSGFAMGLNTLAILGKPDFWKGMGNQLLALAQGFNALFYSGFAKIVDLLKPVLEKVGLGGMVDSIGASLRGAAAQSTGEASRNQAAAADALSPILADGLRRQSEEAEKISQAVVDGFDSAADLFDVNEAQESLDDQLAGLGERLQKVHAAALDKGQGRKRTGALDFGEGTGSKSAPSAQRLTSVGGFGIFVKDPLLSESRRQSTLLEEIAKNTRKGPATPTPPNMWPLVFS